MTTAAGKLGATAGSGTLFRGYLGFLRSKNLFDAVRAKVSPATAKLFDNPPAPSVWNDGKHFEEVLTAVHELATPESVQLLGFFTSKEASGPIVSPIIRTMVALSGTSPASIVSKMDRVTSMLTRGYGFAYQPSSETAGTVTIWTDEPKHAAVWHSWQGTFVYFFEMTKVRGTATVQIQPNRCGAAYPLSW
jgi:hypothetical protein